MDETSTLSSADQAAVTAACSARCARWNNRKVRYRPPGEVFDARFAAVEAIDESSAKAFVERHHYSGSYPAARLRAGILIKEPFRPERLAGVAVFSVPMTNAVITSWLGVDNPRHGVELGRFVLAEDLAANAESWTIARALKLVRKHLPEVKGVVAFCDPVERRDVSGNITKRSHVGTVYLATNARAAGRSSARTQLLTPSGRILSPRALSKIRNEERGIDYALRQLERNGAPARHLGESGADYLLRLRSEGFLRAERHPGNYAFTFRLAA